MATDAAAAESGVPTTRAHLCLGHGFVRSLHVSC